MSRGAGKIRLDRLLVERGLAESREKAQGMILAGEVEIDGRRADKAGTAVAADARVEVRSSRPAWVSRSGAKLEGALTRFGIPVAGRQALDIGASTGGFTECLLRRGAASVIALDVGRGQLHWSLRTDPRVVPLEGMNARMLEPADLPASEGAVDLVVVDVSFISLRLILPAVARILPAGDAVVLVKPQFEAGRGKVGRGGILRDPAERERALRAVATAAGEEGFHVDSACVSPLPGAEGNVEFFLHLTRGDRAEATPLSGAEEALARAVLEAAELDTSAASAASTASAAPAPDPPPVSDKEPS